MSQFSVERMQRLDEISHRYFAWLNVLEDAGIKDVQDLQGQYLLKCPFHDDRRPSFRIRLNVNLYHCFSCGRTGSVADLMFRTSGTTMKKSMFYEQLLKSNPALQKELGFNSLYIDDKSLDAGFNSRRRFSAENHIGSSMPISVLRDKVKKAGDTWENLVYSMTMLQEGELPEVIAAKVEKMGELPKKTDVGEISLLSLLPDES